MTPAALLQGVAFRLRAARAAPRAWWSLTAGAALSALALGVAKAGVTLPAAAAPEALAAAGVAAAALLGGRALLSGPGLAEAAYAIDARTGGAERFATLLDMAGAEGNPFRPAIARACAALSKRTTAAEVVPVRPSRALLGSAATALLLTIAAFLAPRAGDAERALMAAEAGRLRAVAGALGGAGGDAGEVRERLKTLAAALASGRLDREELQQALLDARDALERARRREHLPDALRDLAREHPTLTEIARIGETIAPGALEEERGRAAADAAHDGGQATRDARAAALRTLEPNARDATPETDPLLALADAIARGNIPRAEAAAHALAQDVDDAGWRRAALSQAAAMLEASERRLPGGDGAGATQVAMPGANPGAAATSNPQGASDPAANIARGPDRSTGSSQHADATAAASADVGRVEARTALPERLEAAVARFFHSHDEESPR